MEDIDVWRAAHQLMKRHGDTAEDQAARRGELAFDCGDEFNANLWYKIAMAIAELRRTAPEPGELIH